MSDPGVIPELVYTTPDGRLHTRLEMEQWLRNNVPKVHWLRIIANRVFHLQKLIAWDMREIVLKHWLLDEMIRQKLITGDTLGINTTASNDESELRQFTQKLAALIHSGQAVQPQHSEGVDMSGYTPPPPPPMGGPPQVNNSQPQFTQPGPPSYTPPGPPGYPSQATPPPMGPPAGPPMTGPPMGPPMGPPSPPPQAVTSPTNPRRGRPPKDPSTTGPVVNTPPNSPLPQPPAQAPVPIPAGFAPLPGLVPSPAIVTSSSDNSALEAKIEQVLASQARITSKLSGLEKKIEIASMVTTVLGRAIYQKQGSQDAAGFLAELGLPVPQ